MTELLQMEQITIILRVVATKILFRDTYPQWLFEIKNNSGGIIAPYIQSLKREMPDNFIGHGSRLAIRAQHPVFQRE